jgi:hypothetical protein
MKKSDYVRLIKRGLKQKAEEDNKEASESQEFATCTQLKFVFGYKSDRRFKEQFLSPLEVIPPNLYAVDDLADAMSRGIVPVKQGRRGRSSL